MGAKIMADIKKSMYRYDESPACVRTVLRHSIPGPDRTFKAQKAIISQAYHK
ncbi:MAG: hypothetical protein PVH53_04400 [Desulfobacterales bacterium]